MRSLYILLMIGLSCARIFGQSKATPILERKITLSIDGEDIVTVLARIEKEANFSFSYNSNIISPAETVTIHVANKTVREVLQMIFKGAKNYKEKNGYLILTQAPPPPKEETTVTIISGYVEDEKTGNKISNASVYDKTTLASAVTDQFGYYKLTLDQKDPAGSLTISKKDYLDTLVKIVAPGNQLLNISIVPHEPDSISIHASTKPVTEADQKFPYQSEPNVQNIRDTLFRVAQVSFLPFIGTNLKLSGNVVNDYSFNVLGGFSMGTRVAEFAGLFNIDRSDVKRFQLSGLFNIDGGNVSGVQMAGLLNANRKKLHAAQIAGLINFNEGEVDGVQIGGLVNANRQNVSAAQIAGLANFNLDTLKGAQVAGLININSRSAQGLQLAGLVNLQHEDYHGSQIAGLINIADKEITGTQLSGIYNLGHEVHGSQIGFLNFSDTIRGVPIGFLSFSTKGYHQIELSADEIFYANVAFRTGVRQFYNIFTAGINPQKLKDPLWTVGYGVGTSPKIAKHLYLNIDVTTNHISQGDFLQELSMLNKVYVGAEFQTKHKISFTAGATVNGYFTNNSFTEYPDLFTGYKPHTFDEHQSGNTNVSMWIGFKAGIRFL